MGGVHPTPPLSALFYISFCSAHTGAPGFDPQRNDLRRWRRLTQVTPILPSKHKEVCQMAANSKKLDAKKIASLVDFIESKTNFPRLLILDAIFKFGHLYDLSALLRYFEWAQDNHEKDAAILSTVIKEHLQCSGL